MHLESHPCLQRYGQCCAPASAPLGPAPPRCRSAPRAAASSGAERPVVPTLDRRHLLSGALLAAPLLLARGASAVESSTQTFMSSEGFAFDFPTDWVVAFDRSGSVRGSGAVMVAGDFRTFDTVSVFRTEVPAADVPGGLTEDLGYRLAVEPQLKEASTMRFQQLGGALAQGGGTCGAYYDYEYTIETCRGEIIEGAGGRIQCLGPQGQDLQTLRRHHIGRALLVGNYLYMLNASAPVDRWPQLQTAMAAVVGSFRC